MKKRIQAWLLAVLTALSLFPMKVMAADASGSTAIAEGPSAENYVLLSDTEDFTIYTRNEVSEATGMAYPWTMENGAFISGNPGAAAKTISSSKIVFKKAGVVSFDWVLCAEESDLFAYRVSADDFSILSDMTAGTYYTGNAGEKSGREEQLVVESDDILYLGYYRGSQNTENLSHTVTISNIKLTPRVEGGDSVVTDHIVYDDTMGAVSVQWVEPRTNEYDGSKYKVLTPVDESAVENNKTYRLQATAAEGNQFYGWVREYTFNGETKYEFMPMTYYTLKTVTGSNGVITNTDSAVTNPELEVTLDERSAYRAVFAPKGTYVLRKNAQFFDSSANVADIINTASAGDVIELLKDVTLTEDVTVPKNVLLYVPYRSGWSEDDAAGKYRDGGFNGRNATTAINTKDHYVTLTVSGSLNVNGTLAVGSVVGYNSQRFQGHISGAHGRIVNNSNITVNSGGTMTCYGLVEGSGTVHVADGGILREMFIIGDFAGGSNTAELFFTSQMPFKRFSMQRVQCTLTMNTRSKLMAMMHIWANSVYNEAEVVLFGDDPKAAFYPTSNTENTLGLTRTYDPDQALTDGNGLLDVTGIGRTEWTFSNGLKFQPLTISLGGISVDTGSSDFTIPYNFKIRLGGGEYNIPLGMRIMPGAEVVVEEGASVNIGGRLMVMDGLVQTDMSTDRYPTRAELEAADFSGSGELTINGTLTMETGATLGGVVKNNGTGKLVICEGVYLNNSGDMTALDPTKDLSNHPYTQYTAEGGVAKTESGKTKVHNWVQQDGALGEYDENTTWFNLPAQIYMDGELQKVKAGKTYLGSALDADETVSYDVDYLYVEDGVYGSIGNSKYGYKTASGQREMTWAHETVERTMNGTWVDSESSNETVEVTQTSVAGFSADTVEVTCTLEKSGTSTLVKDLQVMDKTTNAARAEKFVFLVKYTTEGDLNGKTIQPVDGVYTVPPEANGVKIEACLLGDITGDGQIKANDYKKLKSFILEKITSDDVGEMGLLASDITGDSQIKANDYKKLKSFILEKISTL